ncbi:MAG: very short patch repair endonuclease [Treponema sp.]|nr:very short patch repair endonuclease [Treponema sp.]
MGSLTPEHKYKAMSNNKSKNTSIEVLLRKALWHEGIRYRKNLKTLPGCPDIAITKCKIAIFCDGEFWHGKNWETIKDRIKTNRNYWIPKIERNIARDNMNDKKLGNIGWVVLHFWGNDIKKNLDGCIAEIKEVIYKIKNGIYNEEYNAAFYLLAAENEHIYNH